MEIPSPFVVLPDTGQLSLYGFHTRFGPRLRLPEFQESDIFPFAVRVTHFPEYDPGYQIDSITLEDGRWAYIFVGFQEGTLVRLGFGWGMLREYGFHELTPPEFQQQLRSYKAWLESALGPSLPCCLPISYSQEFRWGKIEASTDRRTNLTGIGIWFNR